MAKFIEKPINELNKNDISFYSLLLISVITIAGGFVFSISVQTISFIILSLTFSYLFVRKKFEDKSIFIFLLPVIAIIFSSIGADFQSNIRIVSLGLYNALIAFFITLYSDKRNKENIFIFLIVLGLWVSLIFLAQVFISNYKDMPLFSLNVNIIAGFLLLIYPLIFAFIEKRKYTLFFIFIALIVFIAIIMTKSRSAIILSYIITVYYFFKLKKDISFKILFLILTTIMIAGIISAFYFKMSWSSMSERIVWWKTALLMSKEYPVFGIGFGNFSALFLYFRPEQTLNTLFCHNIILQILAETGIFGIIVFMIVVYAFIKKTLPAFKNTDDFLPYRKAAIIAVLAFFVLNLADYSFFIPANLMFFAVISAFVFDIRTEKRKKIFPAILIFLPAIIFSILYSIPLKASWHFDEGNFLLEQGKINEAKVEYELALKYDRSNPEYLRALADIYMQEYFASEIKNKDYILQALESILKAEKAYKHSSQIKAEAAYMYKLIGNDEKALEYADLALKYDKFNPFYQNQKDKKDICEE